MANRMDNWRRGQAVPRSARARGVGRTWELRGAPEIPQGAFWASAMRRSIWLCAASLLSFVNHQGKCYAEISPALPFGKINTKL